MEKNYPCPCGGKLQQKKENIVKSEINFGRLSISFCKKCGTEYFPEESMSVIELGLKKAQLWGVKNNLK